MITNKDNSKKSGGTFNKLLNSLDNLLNEEKEQKLKLKLGKEIKNRIFTDEILTKLNENDFSDLIDKEENDITTLFSSIFPIFIKKNDIIFRLYKHKIEVNLSNEMSDRYIYIFADGRLTSGLFQCFTLSDDEYVYGVKKIIDVIPLFREAILNTLENFKKNIEIHNNKIAKSKNREPLVEKNYNELFNYLSKK
ncbi:hypothetical protein B0P06_002283 [Clostridium saccharoperbutylacetonicum]|uniref:Uncharacterized protein n=1 Tax=Clostridium saccharoperbutylacetonicum N1-4(HMT) TaxID=931276 RepID=M1M1B6_9CLOT|nr:hypothetical protein [Clostridium saccharoperbutylacetonicum]AGF59380.1 hypothetical protein Cspa_c56550 [Clostridium saccharoperbutylacetonicum N1-4(HMT)]NRT59829.1 hypothetical protein [Clostridium saccharoperbutylacetonicum]NSB23141.1 hypothetical protein [Clostridium saccharoperbutylacetonicum]NSB42512.1 hypothetical protein [Clostridium saccharoperbutylacetonicum]